nr:RNA-directed DNA polymerase, eukaryota [Tanacetum cinerariifolium]
ELLGIVEITNLQALTGLIMNFSKNIGTWLDLIFVKRLSIFFTSGGFSKGCNSSFVTLIPKIIDAKFVNDFRPISLIGCVYKVVTKVLANRLVSVIGDLVSDTQSAFVAGRQILDGPFILDEILKWCKRMGKQAMFFKVDFAKAYDSVRWDYLIDVLEAFGFGSVWCNWIRGILYSSKASILVNGSPTKEFSCYRGLKQGDPLAPYLFILVMESLHLSFSRVVEEDLFKGEWSDNNLKVPRGVLKALESIRNRFFNGADQSDHKITWVAWDKVLASKKKGGLGVSSFFALNRALLLKWVWRFVSQDGSLWCKELTSTLETISLSNSSDRWICDLTSDGVFRVKEVWNCIDDIFLPSQVIDTRWVRFVPIKVNIFIWRARQDCLPTRVNLVRRGINVDSCVCPIFSTGEDEINHILFRCDLAQQVLRRICRWWELDPSDWNTFQEWIRNHIIFEGVLPRRSEVDEGQADIKAVSEYYNSLIKKYSSLSTSIIDADAIERIQAAFSSKGEIQKVLNEVRRSLALSEDIFQDSQDPYDNDTELLDF